MISGLNTGQVADVISIVNHRTSIGLRLWNGFASARPGPRAAAEMRSPAAPAAGGSGRPLVQFPAERTGLRAAGNAEIFPLEAASPKRAAPPPDILRRTARTSSRWLSAEARTGRRLSQAIQNGSVRLQAVDSIANRACGRRARIGRSARSGLRRSRAASSATIQPSTVRPRMESSLPGSAKTREPFLSSRP